jgi:hypothetical protein
MGIHGRGESKWRGYRRADIVEVFNTYMKVEQ